MTIDVPFILRWRAFSRWLKPCGVCNDCCSRSPQHCEAWDDPEYIVDLQIPEWHAQERR